jgi:hypothetical protein
MVASFSAQGPKRILYNENNVIQNRIVPGERPIMERRSRDPMNLGRPWRVNLGKI